MNTEYFLSGGHNSRQVVKVPATGDDMRLICIDHKARLRWKRHVSAAELFFLDNHIDKIIHLWLRQGQKDAVNEWLGEKIL